MKINWRPVLGVLGFLILPSGMLAQKSPLSGVHRLRVEDVKQDNSLEGFRQTLAMTTKSIPEYLEDERIQPLVSLC
jgi:hypothetical protein